jgi:hypothetical protein
MCREDEDSEPATLKYSETERRAQMYVKNGWGTLAMGRRLKAIGIQNRRQKVG